MNSVPASCLGGCSALTAETRDGLHLFARNYDFPANSQASVLVIPRETPLQLLQHAHGNTQISARYSALGVGNTQYATPILFDGVNEKGLCGAMLNYPGYAVYETNAQASHLVSPAFYLTILLTTCASIDEADAFLQDFDFSNEEIISGVKMPIHYFLTDASGEAVVIEPDAHGVNVYRHSIGVLTNAPSYPWHLTNLRNYLSVTPRQPDTILLLGETLAPFGLGAGAHGLPGDFTPPSRFVRLAYIKNALGIPTTERDGVTALCAALENVAMPRGFVHNAQGAIEETVYTSVMYAESGTYYLTPYTNRRLTAYTLEAEKDDALVKEYMFPLSQDVAMGNF